MLIPPEISFRCDAFDYVDGVIYIPSETVWYRAYNPILPRLTEHVTFFGDKETAWLYATGATRPIGKFSCQKSLRLLDIRFVQSLLRQLLCKDNAGDIGRQVVLALGLCSFKKQMDLIREQIEAHPHEGIERSLDRMHEFFNMASAPGWTFPEELQGVRVGITDIDYDVMTWLRGLFAKVADGIIAPRMPSPFHDQLSLDVEKSVMMEEIIIFHPTQVMSYVADVPTGSRVDYDVPTASFQSFVIDKLPGFISNNARRTRRAQLGGSTHLAVRDEMMERICQDHALAKAFAKKERSWEPQIRKLQKQSLFLRRPYFCVPMITPSDPS